MLFYKENLPECPVATTVQLIGSKWKLLILRNLRVRTVYPEVPVRTEYSLSETGKSMLPIIEAMEAWGTASHHHLVLESQLVLLETEYTFHDKCGRLTLVDVPLDMEEPPQWSCHQFPALPCLP